MIVVGVTRFMEPIETFLVKPAKLRRLRVFKGSGFLGLLRS